jgi:hypothetical protein
LGLVHQQVLFIFKMEAVYVAPQVNTIEPPERKKKKGMDQSQGIYR